jgi:hypothetical protein
VSTLESEITFGAPKDNYKAGIRVMKSRVPFRREVVAWVDYRIPETGYEVVYEDRMIVWGTFERAVALGIELSDKVIDTADPNG